MKREIGFVAIGQAGGNIGKLFEKMGYTVLYINTSEEDLKTLPDAAHKFHLDGGEGCNKDRAKAKKLLAHNIEKVLEQVLGKVPQKLIFTIFSAGGGTGSGIGPMLTDILQQEAGKTVGAITILPDEKESVKAHVNAWDCVRELADISEMGASFFIDNNSGKGKIKLNEIFAGLLNDFVCIPEKKASALGNIDRAEIKEVLSTKGAAIISRTSKQDTTTARVIEYLRKGIFADLDEEKAVKYMAVLAAGGQAVINMQTLQAEFGTAYDIFQGFEAEQTICCLSGLRFPFSRMEKIKERAMENQGDIIKSLNAVNMNPMSEGLDLFASVKKPEKKKGNSRDLLKQFL
ncbi:MAG: hypothetical protein HFI29_05320 [Lachnospiraceae bacterium]|jgi:cell division GTPase FtsZ|nr:hypothetical protein [Lachnospiraceae bacterium]